MVGSVRRVTQIIVGHGLEFCHRLWQKLGGVRVGAVEGEHLADIPLRKPFHLGELVAEVPRQAGDDRRAVPLQVLPGVKEPTDVPVEPDRLSVDREDGADLGRADAVRDLDEQDGVVGLRGGFFLLKAPAPGGP